MTQSPSNPDRRPIAWLVGVYVLSRLIVAAVAFATAASRPEPAELWQRGDPFMRWDAGHYLRILVSGYPSYLCDTVAFFPLYPLTAWPLAQIIDPGWALVLVAHLAGLVATLGLYSVARRWTDGRTAFFAAVLFCAYPSAMFLSTGYADALFTALVAGSLWGIAICRPALAAILCGLATATRPTGLALAVVIWLWAWLRTVPASDVNRVSGLLRFASDAVKTLGRRWLRLGGLGLLCISGNLAHFGYLWVYYGRPDAYFACQEKWELPPPHHALEKTLTLRPVIQPALEPIKCVLRGQPERLLHQRTWNMAISVTMILLSLIGLFRPGGAPRMIYLFAPLMFLMAYLPDTASGGRMIGLSRYMLASLPSWMVLARWPLLHRRRWTLVTLLVFGATLEMIQMACFTANEPAF